RQYPHDLRQPLPLVPNSQGRRVIPFHHFINNDLEYLRGGKSSRDFHRLWIQDIEDMILLLMQEKMTNLNVEERIAFNVSLRMFTRSVVIQRRVEDLQLGVESYQKKLNLTKPDTYRSNLRRRDTYTPYSDPKGFIYENKDKKNRFMRIDELHKFSDGTLDDVRTALNDRLKGIRMEYISDGTLDDVRTALNDRLKGIRMEYLPQTFWNQRNKANARAMIQAIDKRLKTRGIMRSLERFVGGRPYGGCSNKEWLVQGGTALGKDQSNPLMVASPRLDAAFLVADSKFKKVAFGVGFRMLLFNPLVYVVPTGRVKAHAGRYVVPTGTDKVIVSVGRTKVIPAGRTILVLVVLCLLRVDS
ncbi:hypothetical protein Tco_0459903, partial [Tanacetum coccineum]